MTEDIKKVIGIIDCFVNTANVIKEESQDVITRGLCESKIRVLNQLKDNITNTFSLKSSNCGDDLEKEIDDWYKKDNSLMMTREQFGKLVHHFTDYQKRQTIEEAYKWLESNIARNLLIFASGYAHIECDKVLSEFCKALEDEI